MALPMVLFLLKQRVPAKQPPAPAPFLLDKLREQGLLTDSHLLGHASSSTSQQQAAQTTAPAPAPGALWPSTQQIAAAAQYFKEEVAGAKQRPAVPAKKYVIPPEPFDMRRQHKQVSAYLASPEFKAKVAARKARGQRGIIINAGGPNLISSTIVTLKVLREVLNCSLPVELVWHATEEMDNATIAALRRRWGPIVGINLDSMPWPSHHRAKEVVQQPNWNQGFFGKVMSLTASSFASALLLDADSMPLANPEGLLDDASFTTTGNLFFPDFWSTPANSQQRSLAYDMVGLEHDEAQALLAAGKGRLQRDTESGQLLFDLVKHADVAEWALSINSFGDVLYKALWGDKDTYSMAFAVAGKAHLFNQLQVPPGAALTWRNSSLLVKATQQKTAGWQLAGMLQFDAAGQPAFLHRTMNKFSWGGEAWHLGLITGPLPLRWVNYYLSQDAQGPTVGVPYDYVAPASAFVQWHIPQPLARSTAQTDGWAVGQEEACPAVTFLAYWRLREHAVPTGSNASLDSACTPLLASLLRSNAAAYAAAGLLQQPQLLELASAEFDRVITRRTHSNKLVPPEEVLDSTPALAWVPDYLHPAVDTIVSRALAGSYQAMQWLQQHAVQFAMFANVTAAQPPLAQQQQQQQQQQQKARPARG
uniref:Mannosyltransferase putative-domain-containing protein n=1 Tax=Tetradesmus obliquus TaxID=3088 RepID=A0A383VV11_TETOB|eukprot:jgi/Sobl393_1/7871/SZX68750.1